MSNTPIPLDMPNLRIGIIDSPGGLMTSPFGRLITDIIRRLGGQRVDFVQDARTIAYENQAMVLAILRGITLGYYHNPANPLDFTATTATTATITVSAHTRSTAASPLQAGSVATPVARGATYYVYYADAGNLGGAVTYLATTDVSGLTTAGRKLVGAVYVENPAPAAGGTE